MGTFCESCTFPLDDDSRSANPAYCRMCTNDEGVLHPRDMVKGGIARWLMSWQEGISTEVADRRAEHFMNAMPAWSAD